MKRISAKKLAEKAYYSQRTMLAFDDASGTTEDQADYIFDIACEEAESILGDELDAKGEKYADEVRTELYESIWGGLT